MRVGQEVRDDETVPARRPGVAALEQPGDALGHAVLGGVGRAAATASGSMSMATTRATPSLTAAIARMPVPVPMSSARAGRSADDSALEQREAALRGAVMPGAERAAGLDDTPRPRRSPSGRRIPRRHDQEARADRDGAEVLPRVRPVAVDERRDLRRRGPRGTRAPGATRDRRDRARGAACRGRVSGKNARRRAGSVGGLFLDDAERARLPEEVGERLRRRRRRDGDGQLPERVIGRWTEELLHPLDEATVGAAPGPSRPAGTPRAARAAWPSACVGTSIITS